MFLNIFSKKDHPNTYSERDFVIYYLAVRYISRETSNVYCCICAIEVAYFPHYLLCMKDICSFKTLLLHHNDYVGHGTK